MRKKVAENLDGYLIYLDALRESGVTNMLGAVPYLTETFSELTTSEARAILLLWQHTFTERQRE